MKANLKTHLKSKSIFKRNYLWYEQNVTFNIKFEIQSFPLRDSRRIKKNNEDMEELKEEDDKDYKEEVEEKEEKEWDDKNEDEKEKKY